MSELGIDSDRLAIAGVSAGGGLAAGVALMALDRKGPRLCPQFLLYGMLDDRHDVVSGKQFWDEGSWPGKSSIQGWDLVLAGKRNTDDATVYASPGRAKDLSGFPPAFIEVGSAETLRDEIVAYASKLYEYGVQAELHV